MDSDDDMDFGDDDVEYDMTYEQSLNLRYGETTTTEIVEGMSKGLQRMLAGVNEGSRAQMANFLKDDRFRFLTESRAQAIMEYCEKMKNFTLLNTEVAVFASLWMLDKKKLDKKELSIFCTTYKIPKEIQPDLVRYIRAFSTK